DDRPYAASLTAALSLVAASDARLGAVALSLGVVGPAALGEQVQDLVHDAIGVEKLGGWGHQIGNRPVAMLTLEQRWRLERTLARGPRRPFGGPFEIDAVPGLGLHPGNLQTSAGARLLLRLGQGLAMDFGPPRMPPSLSSVAVSRPPEGLAWYVYAGVEGRAVAYDATLDGNRNGYWRIDRRPLVGEVAAGLALAWGPLRPAGSVVVQSATLDEQSRTPHPFTATRPRPASRASAARQRHMRRHRPRALAAAALWGSLAAAPAAADPAPARFERGVLTLTFENDALAGNDRYYTSGQRIGWQSRGGAPAALADAAGWLAPWLLPAGARPEWGGSVGRALYTPRARRPRRPPRDDRPYAGALPAPCSLPAAGPELLGGLRAP